MKKVMSLLARDRRGVSLLEFIIAFALLAVISDTEITYVSITLTLEKNGEAYSTTQLIALRNAGVQPH